MILAGMGKQFNFQDLNAKLLIHPDYGLGADAILPDRRMVVSTLNKQVIRRQLLEESLGEENPCALRCPDPCKGENEFRQVLFPIWIKS